MFDSSPTRLFRYTKPPSVQLAEALLCCCVCWCALWQALARRKSYVEALAMLGSALELEPGNTQARYQRATVLMSMDRNEVRVRACCCTKTVCGFR